MVWASALAIARQAGATIDFTLPANTALSAGEFGTGILVDAKNVPPGTTR